VSRAGRRCLLAALLIAGAAIAVRSAAEPVDQTTIDRMAAESRARSSVMETVVYLADVYGPRLSGSPNLKAAQQWSRDRLAAWGLDRAGVEPYGAFGRGWSIQRHSLEMIEPQYARLIASPKAWSPSTPGTITGRPVLVDIHSASDLDGWRGKLRGAIVLLGRPQPLDQGFAPEARRFTDEELRRQSLETDPAAQGRWRSYWDEERGFLGMLQRARETSELLAAEGIAALLLPSALPQGVVHSEGSYDHDWKPRFPTFDVAREHYGRIVRLLDRKVPVTLELALQARYDDDDPTGYNVVAEIPGVDPARRDELVMLGAHLDSWHAGTGATDNAAGCAVVMEAMRILKAIGAAPRRTIRLALWSGEEQGYLGSRGYVTRHFADLETLRPAPAHARVSAYFNVDNGSGRIRGVNLQGNEAVRPIFEAWLRPFHAVGAATLTTLNRGGTDHMPFDAVGLPAFQFIQDPLAYETRTHHSNLDLVEAVLDQDLRQASVIVASFVYHAAMRDEKLPRKPAPAPRSRP
jgi:hypothetical protein